MPIYEFECLDCGEYFEALVRDAKAPACPACSSQKLEQLISMFSVDSETTRQANLKGARRKNASVQRDKAIAEHEEVQKHHD